MDTPAPDPPAPDPPVPGAPAEPSDAGEPACLLHLVCDACGRLDTDRSGDARGCTACGAPPLRGGVRPSPDRGPRTDGPGQTRPPRLAE
ncbi:hypothetical protein [Streptomyces erythrochromogenes]|uniref:hypothetical protein n=1 Tax=Streptomyces erythrochromogenes TaxID=285574 RepID=UPI00340ADC41